jgi:hypothetical protein
MPNKSAPCQIWKKEKRMHEILPAEVLRPSLVRFIEGRYADWSPSDFICLSDLNRFRTEYVKQVIEAEVGEISALENEVLASLRARELLSTNMNDARETFGERLSDGIDAFGGSWKFIIVFFALLLDGSPRTRFCCSGDHSILIPSSCSILSFRLSLPCRRR